MMRQDNITPICMVEEYWANTQLSIARHYGRIQAFGYEYWIVNKDGLDLFALSAIAEKQGKQKAIEAGEPADLVRTDFMQYYRKLKRDKFLEVLKANPNATDKELKVIFKEMTTKKKEKKEEPNLFDV